MHGGKSLQKPPVLIMQGRIPMIVTFNLLTRTWPGEEEIVEIVFFVFRSPHPTPQYTEEEEDEDEEDDDHCTERGAGKITECITTCILYTSLCIHSMNEFVCLSVWGFSSTLEFFTSIRDIIIAGEELHVLTCARHSWPLSSEGSLVCHTYCDTGKPI